MVYVWVTCQGTAVSRPGGQERQSLASLQARWGRNGSFQRLWPGGQERQSLASLQARWGSLWPGGQVGRNGSLWPVSRPGGAGTAVSRAGGQVGQERPSPGQVGRWGRNGRLWPVSRPGGQVGQERQSLARVKTKTASRAGRFLSDFIAEIICNGLSIL